jgi:Tfp pilus assembly protein PilF
MSTLEATAPERANPPGEPSGAARLFLVGLALLLLTACAYSRVWFEDFQFLNADDDRYITENPHVRTGLSRENVAWALTAFHSSNWHPLTWISLQLDAQLFGSSAHAFHVTNVVLHALNSVLLLVVLWRLTRPRPTSPTRKRGPDALPASPTRERGNDALPTSPTCERGNETFWLCATVAAFFAVHPLHVESVAWVSERKDVLSGLFFMLTLWAYAVYTDRPSLGRYLLAALLFALGLMAKQMLVTLPCVLLLLDYWPLGHWQPGVRRRLIVEKLPLLALSAGVAVLAVRAQGGMIQSTDVVSLGDRLANAVVSYIEYLRTTFWPTGLAFFYPLDRRELVWWRVAGSALVLITVSVLAVSQRRKRPYLLVGWSWFVGMLVPVIGVVQLATQARADRYTYLPSIGIFIALAWGAGELVLRWRHRWVGAAGVAGLLAACAALTWVQTDYWRDSVTLWQRTLAVTRDNGGAHLGLAITLEKEGKNDLAEPEYLQAVELLDNAAAHVALGKFYLRQGKLADARKHLVRAVELMPEAWASRYELGRALLLTGQVSEAREQLAEVVRLAPEHGGGHYHLGLALARLGALDQAEDELTQAVLSRPNHAEARYQLGNVLFREGKLDQAWEQFAAALQNDPKHAPSLAGQGLILARTGKPEQATTSFRQAVNADPRDALAHSQLAACLHDQGKYTEAATAFRVAAELEPGLARRRADLALALADEGKSAQSEAEYREATRLDPGWIEAAHRAAWVMLQRKDLAPADGLLALRLARQACGGAGKPTADMLDALAAAYAEVGRFDDAVINARKALALAEAGGQETLVRQIQGRLARYERRQPKERD